MRLVDTHAHIHSVDYLLKADQVLADAVKEGVDRILCVGTDIEDSKLACDFANGKEGLYATIGIHPHYADKYLSDQSKLDEFKQLVSRDKVVAIGECGLDYYYNNSTKDSQAKIFELQLQLAIDNDLPVIMHVRDGFSNLWPILDQFKGVRGVLHSYTDSLVNLEQALGRGLYIGVNGIATFTKSEDQLNMYKKIPLDRLILETDSPYLTPVPFRGTICQPKHVKFTADFLASLRGETVENIANQSTKNAVSLFNL